MGKFLALYGLYLFIAVILVIALCVGAAYGLAVYRERRDERRRDRLVKSARFSDRSAQENIIALDQGAQIVQALVNTAADDPMLSIALADILTESTRWLDDLSDRGLEAKPLPRRRQAPEEQPRPRRSPG